MPRELREIGADPQPTETVLLPDGWRVRVTERTPTRVHWREERNGSPVVRARGSVGQWRARIAGGTPEKPTAGIGDALCREA